MEKREVEKRKEKGREEKGREKRKEEKIFNNRFIVSAVNRILDK